MTHLLRRTGYSLALAFAFSTFSAGSSFAISMPTKSGGQGYVPVSEHKIPLPADLMVGKEAPDFEGLTSEGQTIKLSDFKGKMVVLEWHNPECPFVKKHYDSNNMQTLQHFARSEGAVWLTINSSGLTTQGYIEPRKAQEYYEKNNMQANHYVIDPEGKIGGAYHAKTTPDMVVIDAGGYIAYTGAIDNIPSADPKDVPKAKNYVQSALENMLMGKPASPYATQPYGCSVKYKRSY